MTQRAGAAGLNLRFSLLTKEGDRGRFGLALRSAVMPTPLRRVYDNVRAGQVVFRDAARLGDILAVLVRHGFGAFVQALKLQDRWLPGKLLESTGTFEDKPIERRILLAVQELGPTFIKLGQMMSTRPDLLPASLIAELATLQDSVPRLSTADVHQIIREELSGEPPDLFAEFCDTPLASASIAQVHRARLKDGRDVVVKVQRPNLKPQFEADLEIMGFLARALETNFPETMLFSPTGMVAEFERAIFKEIDFGIELRNLERFRRNFADNPRVRFPDPHHALSTARVLTMELIDGVKITEIADERFDVDVVMETAFEAVLQMIYADGFFHGDLHPGNVLIRDGNIVCFIDVGLCGRLSPRQQDLLTDMLIAVSQQSFEDVARLFWRMAIHGKESTTDYGVFEADVIEHAEGWFAGKTMAQIEFGRVIGDLIALSLRHRLSLPPDYTMTFKAVITMEGVGKQLRPDLDLLTAARPYAASLLAQRYQPQRLLQSGYTAVRDLVEALGSAPELTRSILEDIRAGRALINVESAQLDRLRATYARAQQRNTVGLLAGVFALCGTLALDYGEATFIGVPVLSLCFFALAAALGIAYATGSE